MRNKSARQIEPLRKTTDSTPSSAPPKTVIHDSDVARRAYALFLERGGEHGYDLDDWLQAERELKHVPSLAIV
jgi:hypothetical protein